MWHMLTIRRFLRHVMDNKSKQNKKYKQKDLNFIAHWIWLTQSFGMKTLTSSDGAVAMLMANGLVGTGFASRYRLQPRAGFERPNY